MNERETVMSQSRWVVTFQIEQQTYALPIEQVIRIIDMVMLTPLPGLEQSVAGAINIQGAIVPVVDLRHHFQHPFAARKRHTPILLASNGAQLLGLIVDTVLDVFSLNADQQLPVTAVLPPDLPEVPLIQGIARTATGNLWLLLDLKHLFQADQIQVMLEACARLEHASKIAPGPPVEAT